MHDGVILDGIKQILSELGDDEAKAKFQQYLTNDIGREHLKRQTIEITALMSICNTKEEFEEIFKKKYLKGYQKSLFADLPNNEKSKPKIGATGDVMEERLLKAK
jgi:rhamnogalacturonyl hydrolase YesR